MWQRVGERDESKAPWDGFYYWLSDGIFKRMGWWVKETGAWHDFCASERFWDPGNIATLRFTPTWWHPLPGDLPDDGAASGIVTACGGDASAAPVSPQGELEPDPRSGGRPHDDVVEKLTRERDEAREIAEQMRALKHQLYLDHKAAESRVERLEAALTAARKIDAVGLNAHLLPPLLAELRAALGAALSSSDAPHNEPHE